MTLEDNRKLAVALRQWRDDLIDVTFRNPLVDFKARKTSTIDLSGLDVAEVFHKLRSTKLTFIIGTKPERPKGELDDDDLERQVLELEEQFDYSRYPDALFVDRTQSDVDRTLRNLHRRSTQFFIDKGLNPLHFAAGRLRWADSDGETRRAPLLLIPAKLSRSGPRQPLSVGLDVDDVSVNPALVIKLQEFGVEFPEEDLILSAYESSGVEGALDVFRQADLPDGWIIENFLALSAFTFHKESMYRDLLDNEALISGHSVIRALGGAISPTGHNFFFDPVDDSEIDEAAPPETTPLVLDADSSQRAAVHAAINGKSFVLDGPPGTGKSQTISNIIGALISAGKTVLFVSEKIVALEVVKDRLEARGLGSLVFELHSHKTSRKEVAQHLGNSLTRQMKIPGQMAEIDIERARSHRESLNAYAQAMNERRMPLGKSIHDALGDLEILGIRVATPEPSFEPDELTAHHLQTIREAAGLIEKHWDLLLAGEDALWYGVENRDNLAFLVETAMRALETYRGVHQQILMAASSLDLAGPFDVEHLQVLAAKWTSGSDVFRSESWLTSGSLGKISEVIAELSDLSVKVSEFVDAFQEVSGADLRRFDGLSDIPSSSEISALGQILAETSELDAWTTAQLGESLSSLARRSAEISDGLAEYSVALGISMPEAIGEIGRYCEALRPLSKAAPLPYGWFTDKAELEATGRAADELAAKSRALKEARDACRIFQDAAIDLPLGDLATFFEMNQRWFDRFSGDYRGRKKTILAVSNSRNWKQVKSSLPGAGKWQQAKEEYLRVEKKHSLALGDLYDGQTTDWVAVLQTIEELKLFQKVVTVVDRSSFKESLAHASLGGRTEDLVKETNAVVHDLLELGQLLRGKVSWKHESRSLVQTADLLSDAGAYLQKTRQIMLRFEESFQAGRKLDELVEVFSLMKSFQETQASIKQNLAGSSQLLGFEITVEDFLNRSAKIVSDLQARLEWTTNIVELVKGEDHPDLSAGLTSPEYAALAELQLPVSVLEASKRWAEAFEDLCGAFQESGGDRLRRELDDFHRGAQRLSRMKAQLKEVDNWLELERSRQQLTVMGWQSMMDAAADLRLIQGEVGAYIEAGVLRFWVQRQFARDKRFGAFPTLDRSEIIDEYRALDSKLRDHAISQIVETAERNRPVTAHGQAGGILRESEKKARHKPVREQIKQSADVIKALHPCFMMSPLAVSQFLPSDIEFDVVIFDEASQVKPADAINCAYRGNALIAAGDQKQLPPTNFFSSLLSEDEEEEEDVAQDYESILDLMKASGAFKSLTLRWHYRSRHEHLIAFSNTSFYGGKLVTFPGAIDESPDFGVKFFKVDGTYRRGTSRDNPKEARAVVERVFTHFDERPDKTLGVVAFSGAQEEAIRSALTIARQNRPDLDRFFDSSEYDRQGGFFIANLESVQGDERDVIIFSVGYGPDENNKFVRNFGPVSKVGGERRLNVAFTRARDLVEVVASINASSLGDVTSGPLLHLRRYLDFAERGAVALSLELGEQGLDAESPFEESVISEIRSWGYDVQPQVGVAGYRIDIGVIHPQAPGVFLLGVECDGAMYHSSKTARDRDRLRHEVLEGLGWTIHHIWGTSWFRHRDDEALKLRSIIEELVQAPIRGRMAAPSKPTQKRVEVEFEGVSLEREAPWSVDYARAAPESLEYWVDLIDVPREQVSEFVRQVVSVESPIHMDLVFERYREWGGVARVGSNLRQLLVQGINRSGVVVDGNFLLWDPEQLIPPRRPADEVERDIARIHDRELESAILATVSDSFAISESELISAVSDYFGWTRRGEKIVTRMRKRLESLVARNLISFDSELFRAI